MGKKDCRADLAFPYNLPDVFNIILQSAPVVVLTLVGADNVNNIIRLSKDINLTTWGENITVYLGVLPDGRTGVTIISSSVLGTEIMARKHNQKHVDDLTAELYRRLPGGCPQQMQM